jgi:magnesium and cobalt transporter
MYRVKAQTEIASFNDTFGTQFSDQEYDTVGGLLLSRFGRLPKRGEEIELDNLKFRVQRADSRRLHSLLVEKLRAAE